jgi:hypothetical protein
MLPINGDVIYIYWHPAKKPKYLICIDAAQSLFMVINSNPQTIAPANTEILITPSDLSSLKHDSYIFTAALVRVARTDLAAGPSSAAIPTVQLSASIRVKIKAAVVAAGILPQNQVDLVNANL